MRIMDQSRGKRHADDPEVADHRFEGSPDTNLEHKSKRVRDKEEVELNFLNRDDLECLYPADDDGDACGTRSIFTPSDDNQATNLCSADGKNEIVLGDGFVGDEIWMNPLIDCEENYRFLESASVVSNSGKVSTERDAEEALNEENEVREWLLSEENSPSYTANSLNCCPETEVCCIAEALKRGC